jgi:endoglucanase
MKNTSSIFLALIFLMGCQFGPDRKNTQSIRLNQIGYFVNGVKKFVVADSDASSFAIISAASDTVCSGTLENKGTWDQSGEQVSIGDFTELNAPGTFKIALDNGEASYDFVIGDNIYEDLKVAALKTYYLHRISMPIEEQYAGIYHRPMGHEDMARPFHPSTGKTEGTLDTPGGWYDAGDYGKYMINAGIATGMMLAAYEKYPEAYPDNSLNIPESGNGVPDILDEMRYEIEWMLTMQDEDGGVFVKVTTLNFGGMVMPHEAPEDRYVIGKSTAASLNLAAVCAMAARLFEPHDQKFAMTCLEAAINAWGWAMKHPEVYYAKNPEGVFTGAYNDTIPDEEFFWAAAELFVSTTEPEYFETIQLKLGNITFRLEENWRNYCDNIGYYSLLGNSSPLDQGQKQQVADGLLSLAKGLADKHKSIPYQIPVDHFVWGSNSDVLDAAIIFANAHEWSSDKKYLDMAVETFDYLMGKNAVGYSFVTGFGSHRPMHIHHRPSEADGIEAPYPGFVVGGPNFRLQDKGPLEQAGFAYASDLPAKAYIDALPSFASNEICINWNAPAVYMLAFFDAKRQEL